jgi:hypothetical protein
MSTIRPRLCSTLITTLFIALSVQTSLAQAPTATIVRTVLAVTSLPTTDTPLFFKLSKIGSRSNDDLFRTGWLRLCFVGHA